MKEKNITITYINKYINELYVQNRMKLESNN